ncbi:MAG: AtpZ/AtpI family protein [Planctomycetes bacterium]|nr:AtpZ/AtpI family protein [Planctomycetota bacterium]MCB9868271.1 AtpZ/AtpI family protein [Planctomycetota bacterium]
MPPPIQNPRHIGAGLTLAVVVGLFAYGGNWLDERTGLRPLFLLIGVALGFVGGMIHLVHVVAPEMLPFGRDRRSGGPRGEDPGSGGKPPHVGAPD